MVAWQPMQLWDVGFQLSVAATIGLVWLAPLLEIRLSRLPDALRAGLAVALAAQIMTLPVIAGSFGRVSLIAPLSNLAVLWAVPWLMLAAFVTVAVGIVWPAGAAVLGWAAWLFATAILAPAQWLASLPLAAADLPAIGLPAWVIYYLALATLVTALQPRLGITGGPRAAPPLTAPPLRGPAALALAAALVWSAVLALPDGRLHLWFLDVGEGDATLIRTPRGQVILVDGGPSPVAISNALGRVLPFWQRHLDLVVLTHANEDHLLGLVEVARRYRIEQTIEPAVPSASGSFVEWERALAAAETARAAALPGQSVDLGEGAVLQVLWPRGAAAGSQPENRGSVVIRLVYGQVSILLPGDIDAGTGESDRRRRGRPIRRHPESAPPRRPVRPRCGPAPHHRAPGRRHLRRRRQHLRPPRPRDPGAALRPPRLPHRPAGHHRARHRRRSPGSSSPSGRLPGRAGEREGWPRRVGTGDRRESHKDGKTRRSTKRQGTG